MEVEAVDEGKVGKIVVAEGTEGVKVNAVDRRPAGGGRGRAAPRTRRRRAASSGRSRSRAAPRRAPQPAPAAAAGACRRNRRRSLRAAPSGERIFASPLAKRIAAEQGPRSRAHQGLRPATAASSRPTSRAPSRGAGRAGRCAAGRAGARRRRAGAQPVDRGAGDERVPHTAMRKVIARRMPESKQTVPHFYLTVDLRDRRAAGGARGDQRRAPRSKDAQGLGQRLGDQGLRHGAARSSRVQRLVDRGRDDPVRRGRHLGRRRHRPRPDHADRAQRRHEGRWRRSRPR